jgi:Smg protein
MFDVLVYLYENYWRPDACPDHQQLSRKLSPSASRATRSRKRCAGSTAWPQRGSRRGGRRARAAGASTAAEMELLGEQSIGFISLPRIGRRAAARRCARWSSTAPRRSGGPIDLEDLKVIVLMVFWSLGEEPDALVLDELFVAPEERLIH